MRIFDKDELRLLWPFYLEYFIASMLYFAPAFTVLFLYKLNFSFSQIGILIAISPLTSLLFEIPTGAFADLYGRKPSVLVGYFIEGICMLLLFFNTNYYALLGIFALLGIGATFSSGSKDAWIVDLINKKNKKLVNNFFTKMQIFINAGLIISGFLGVLLVNSYGIRIIWLVTAISFLMSIILLFIFTKETRFGDRTSPSLVSQSKETLSYGYKHHVLFYFLIATFLSVIIYNVNGLLAWTPLLTGLNFPDSYFGYIWSILAFFSLLGALGSSLFLKSEKERKFIIISLIFSAIITLGVLFVRSWISAALVLCLAVLFIDMRGPASQVYFHRFIPSGMRATMGSVRSMISYIAGILANVLIGYSLDLFGAKYTILWYIPLTIPIIFILMKIREKNL